MAKAVKKARRFAEDFKQKAVADFEARRAKGEHITYKAAAKKLGIVDSLLRTWIKKYGSDAAHKEAQELPAGHVKPVGRRFKVTLILDSIDDVFAHFADRAESIDVETQVLMTKKRGRRVYVPEAPQVPAPTGSTREQIIAAFRSEKRPLRAGDIAALVGVLPQTVRYHTDALLEEKRIRVATKGAWELTDG